MWYLNITKQKTKEDKNMEITLEMIDAVRERTGADYAEAKEALEKSGGSVVDAIVLLEKKSRINTDEIIGKSKRATSTRSASSAATRCC